MPQSGEGPSPKCFEVAAQLLLNERVVQNAPVAQLDRASAF
jgi:hypothetical protein